MARQVYAERQRPRRQEDEEILLSNEGWRYPEVDEKLGDLVMETIAEIDELLGGDPDDPEEDIVEIVELG